MFLWEDRVTDAVWRHLIGRYEFVGRDDGQYLFVTIDEASLRVGIVKAFSDDLASPIIEFDLPEPLVYMFDDAVEKFIMQTICVLDKEDTVPRIGFVVFLNT